MITAFKHPYAYLVGDLIFLSFWVLLFLFRKDLRREMLIMSIVSGLLFPLALIYIPDYWYPDHVVNSLPLGIEDFLFAFAIGGLGAVLYEVIFSKNHALCECRKRDPRELVAIVAAAVSILVFLTVIFRLNSIYSNYVAFFAIFAYIIYRRRDLLWQAIISGFSVGVLMFVFYQ